LARWGVPAEGDGEEMYLTWGVPNATSITITDYNGVNYGTYGAWGQISMADTCDTTFILSAHFAGNASCEPFQLWASTPYCLNPQ
jgi:hypothetical protein